MLFVDLLGVREMNAAESQRGTADASMLLCDDDGQTFVDYLGAVVDGPVSTRSRPSKAIGTR